MKELIAGLIFTVIGVVLWLTGDGIKGLGFELNKVGLVLAVASGAEALWAAWKLTRKRQDPQTSDHASDR